MKKCKSVLLVRFILCFCLMGALAALNVGCDGDDNKRAPAAADEAADTSATDSDSSGASTGDAATDDAAADDASADDSSSRSSSDMVILCIGDSITQGVGTSDPYPSKLERSTGAQVINTGIRSQQSAAGASRIEGELARYNPTHVCILFGTNDVRVGNSTSSAAGSIQSMVNAVNRSGAKAIVGTIPPLLERNGSLAAGVDEMNGRIKSLSGATIADINRDFNDGQGTISGDGIHPNNNGAAIIAVNFAERL